ncbi:hypothetical protein D3C80_831640 [compost metagenome]
MVVASLEHVHARALGGRIGGAGLQQAARPVGQGDHHRPQAVRPHVVQRRQGHADPVIDACVQQAAFQFGDVLWIVAVALPPGDQALDPVRVGRSARAQLDAVQPHQGAGCDVEGRLHGEVGVIHDHAARLGLGVGVASAGQARHQSPLGRQDVRGAAGLARLQFHVGQNGLGGLGFRDGRDPVDHGLVQQEAPARRDLNNGDGALLALDLILKRRLIIAFRSQQGFGRPQGRASAAPGLESIGGRAIDFADRPLQLPPQLRVQIAANLGSRLGQGVAAHAAQRHPGEKER